MKDEFDELRRNSELENINSLKFNLTNNKFLKTDIDISIRHCIHKYDFLKKQYFDCIRELLQHADLNYVNINSDNSTLMMIACAKGNILLIKELLYATSSSNQNITIDLTLHDARKLNCMHYILYKNTNEMDSLEIINFILNYNEKYKPMIQKALLDEDIKGNTPLTLILIKGWYQMLLKYYELNEYKPYVIKGSNSNLLHCSVTGKNVKCLKLILSYSTLEDIRTKNCEGDTPADLAKRKKFFSFVKRIESYEDMLMKKEAKIDKSLIFKHSINSNEIMELYNEGKYNETLMMLSEYKLNKSIMGDIENLSTEWNIRLTKYQMSNEALRELTKEKILSKFVDSKETTSTSLSVSSSAQVKQTTLIDLIKFLCDHTSNMKIMDHINEESFPIDILIYNKAIVSLSLGDTYSALKTINLSLIHILPQSKDDYYKWIMYVNLTFIIIENLIKMNQIPIASFIISSFEEYLFTTFKQTKKNSYSKDIEAIFDHLNNIEVINQNSPTWDESFCYLNLLKSLCDINNGKKYINEYKKLINNCNYCNEMKIFSRLHAMYMCIKIKMNYHKNYSSKCFKKISLIKELYFNESHEHKVFYYNSIGIVNLKLKNYLNAEYYFKNGIITYMDLINVNKGGKKFLDLNLKGSYLSYMKFNLALSLFYQRKFKQAQEILKSLTQMNFLNRNAYVWYRLGLSTLEIYLAERKKEINGKDNNKCYNDVIKKTVGYTTVVGNINNNKRKETIDENSKENNNINEVIKDKDKTMNSSNLPLAYKKNDNKKSFKSNTKTYQQMQLEEEENSIDELYAQFEREYGNLCLDNNKSYSELDSNNSNNNKPFERKRIVLSSQNIMKPEQINPLNKRELLDAIDVFKQTILLIKEGGTNGGGIGLGVGQHTQILKDIYYYYAKKKEDCVISKGFNQNIFINTYLNLLFCYSLNNNWLNLLYTVKYLLSKHKNLPNDIKIKLSNYQVEAYFALNKHKEAQECLQDNLNTFQQDNFRFDYINKQNGSVVNDVLFKITLNFNLVRVNIMNRNIAEAKKIIKNTIEVYYKGKMEELPGFAINMILFLYLSEGKGKDNNHNENEQVINLIKSRRFDIAKWE